MGLGGDTSSLEIAPAEAVGPEVPSVLEVAMPETREGDQEGDNPLMVATIPPVAFASVEVRPEFRPAGLGAVNRRSSSSSSSTSRGRSTSVRPAHDRAWQERERKDRQLGRETKEVAKLQGEVDNLDRQINDYTQVVSVDATAVYSCRRERDSIKAKETGLLQELAAVRGVLKKKDEKLLAATRGNRLKDTTLQSLKTKRGEAGSLLAGAEAR